MSKSTTYSRYYDPHAVKDLAFSILQAKGRSPDGKSWSILDLCILFDWMHQNIRYEYDRTQYGEQNYIATPAETLKSGYGDCEDHALLFGSLCMAIGASVRMAIVTSLDGTQCHAFTEVCLGSKSQLDSDGLVQTIGGYLAEQSHSMGLDSGKLPFCQGQLAPGWSREDDGSYTCSSHHCVYYREFTEVGWITSGDKVYLPVDDCYGMMYPGDLKKLSPFRRNSQSGWETCTYEDPPAKAVRSRGKKERPKRRANPALPPSRPRARIENTYLSVLVVLVALTIGAGWWSQRLPLAVDGAAGLVVLWYAWRGYEVGFLEQLGRMASWVLPIFGAMWALDPVDNLYSEHVDFDLPFRRYILYALLFLTLFAVLRLALRKVADGHNSSVLDGLLGTVTGALMGTACVYLILLAGLMGTRAMEWTPPVAGSYTVAFTQTFNVLEEGRLDMVKSMIREVGEDAGEEVGGPER